MLSEGFGADRFVRVPQLLARVRLPGPSHRSRSAHFLAGTILEVSARLVEGAKVALSARFRGARTLCSEGMREVRLAVDPRA